MVESRERSTSKAFSLFVWNTAVTLMSCFASASHIGRSTTPNPSPSGANAMAVKFEVLVFSTFWLADVTFDVV